MKILHTGDWHLGHSLYNYDRTDEHRAMIGEIAAIAGRERPDAMIISGDLFHTPTPSAAAQHLMVEGMMKLRAAHPGMTIVVTAGNHDSGTRHEVFARPWREFNIHFIGTLSDNPAEHLIEVEGKGVIVAIPYTHPRNMPDGLLTDLIGMARDMAGERPVAVSAHTTVAGVDFTGHDFAGEESVGGIDTVGLDSFGQGWDYLALGHIHRPQWVAGSGHKARYAGTPLAVSFDESYPHSVSIVEIDRAGETPRLKSVVIEPTRPLVSLPAAGQWAPWPRVRQMLEEFPDDNNAYLRLNVEVDDFLPADAADEVAAIVAAKSCRYCLINSRRAERKHSRSTHTLTVAEFVATAPLDIARRYADDSGIPFGDDMRLLFEQVAKSIENEAEQD